MTIKMEKLFKLGLFVALLQFLILLFVHPKETQVHFQVSSFCFVILLMGLSICYFCYFSRELSPIKLELKRSHYGWLFKVSYFMLVGVNVVGAYLMMGEQASGLSSEQLRWIQLFSQTSLFLVGFDVVSLLPFMRKISFSGKNGKKLFAWMGLLFFLRNPVGMTCFLLYAGLGYGFSRLAQRTGIGRELSFLSHVVRDSILLVLLLMIW